LANFDVKERERKREKEKERESVREKERSSYGERERLYLEVFLVFLRLLKGLLQRDHQVEEAIISPLTCFLSPSLLSLFLFLRLH
jgi:hypothetical protein